MFKEDGDFLLNKSVDTFALQTDKSLDSQQIPLYDIEAVAWLVPLFQDRTTQTPLDFISIPRLPKCDGAVYVTGDSMYPLLKSGDIVLYKEVNDIKNEIFWGEMYLLSMDMSGEEYITVKYIQKSEQIGFENACEQCGRAEWDLGRRRNNEKFFVFHDT